MKVENKKRKYNYVQDLERFFGEQFSTDQLIEAVEEMNVIAGKKEGIPNAMQTAPKTVALGVLAAYKIRELYDGSYYHNRVPSSNYYMQEHMRNQAYQVGMEIVNGKYETMADAFLAYEKNL